MDYPSARIGALATFAALGIMMWIKALLGVDIFIMGYMIGYGSHELIRYKIKSEVEP